jgi:hypothetical protein
MFEPGKHFQPSVMFADKAGAYLSEEPLRCSLLASSSNIELGWKDLPGTNGLAYCEHS